ncbi:MAG: sensor histidine kinase [Armatimonadota bacterium]
MNVVLRKTKANPLILLVIALMFVGIFLLDRGIPLGYAVWLLYLVPLLLTVWVPWRGSAVGVAALCTLLVASAFFLSPHGVHWQVVIANRALALGTFWVLAILLEGRKQMVNALQTSEAWLRITLTSIGDAVLTTDTAGRITFLNPVAEGLTGWRNEDAAGKPVAEVFRIINEQTRRPAEDVVARVLREKRVVGLANHTALLAKDGREIPIEDSAAPIMDRAGRIVGTVLVFHDVTERRQAEDERRRLLAEVQHRAAVLDAILDSMANGLSISDADGRVVRLNRAAERMLGYRVDEMDASIEARLRALQITSADGRPFPTDESPTYQALHGQLVQAVTQVIHRPEHTLWLSVSAAPIRTPDGEQLGAVTTFMDVTRLHEMQEQMQTFVHMVSHDLRTPLSVINGHANLLAETMQASEDQLVRMSTEAIERGVKRMDGMIDDLVDAARLEGGQLQLKPSPIALSAYLPDFLRRHAGVLNPERLIVDVPTDLGPVTADEARLERILANLLTNAQKYSSPMTPIRLHARDLGTEIAVSIADQGQGIPPDDLPHLFDRFYRAKGERRAEGLGLGLYITRLLVEAHAVPSPDGKTTVGGRIWVESEVGKGSTFSFTLPMAPGE